MHAISPPHRHQFRGAHVYYTPVTHTFRTGTVLTGSRLRTYLQHGKLPVDRHEDGLEPVAKQRERPSARVRVRVGLGSGLRVRVGVRVRATGRAWVRVRVRVGLGLGVEARKPTG